MRLLGIMEGKLARMGLMRREGSFGSVRGRGLRFVELVYIGA
jgi:hypothetical protein